MEHQPHAVDSTLLQWKELEDRHEWSGILVGNGASRTVWDKFKYQSLYETAQTENIEHQLTLDDKRIFDQLGTQNFEQVLAALVTSEIVCEALGMDQTAVVERHSSIQQALFEAVHFVHVPWQTEDADIYARIGDALLPYNYVYSTNYDLIIYWAIMADGGRGFKDYFFGYDNEFDLANTELWGKSTKVLYLHGGIHLARLPLGGTVKRTAGTYTNILDSLDIPRMEQHPSSLPRARPVTNSVRFTDLITFLSPISSLRSTQAPPLSSARVWKRTTIIS